MSKLRTPLPAQQETTRTVLKEVVSELQNRKDYEPSDAPVTKTWIDSVFLKVVLGLVVTLTPLTISFFSYQASVERRVTLLEDHEKALVEMNNKLEKQNDKLDKLNGKVDGLQLILAKDGKIAWQEVK